MRMCRHSFTHSSPSAAQVDKYTATGVLSHSKLPEVTAIRTDLSQNKHHLNNEVSYLFYHTNLINPILMLELHIY
jgi:hypothetical protein